MSSEIRHWMAAAACAEMPRAAVRFADLPVRQQRDLVRAGLAAGATSAWLVALGIVASPLPSRSFAAHAVLPGAAATRPPVVLEARAAAVMPETMAPLRLLPRPRPQLALAQASWSEPLAAATGASVDPPQPPRRRNVFSRFFRGVLRGVHAAAFATP